LEEEGIKWNIRWLRILEFETPKHVLDSKIEMRIISDNCKRVRVFGGV
jgi:hypothetical protein